MAAATAAELIKLVSTATESAKLAQDGDAAEQQRAIDALKLLAKQVVTVVSLKETEAGKKVAKLAKHEIGDIAAAATAAVAAWKECVRSQQKQAGSQGGSGGGGSGDAAGLLRSASHGSAGLGPSSSSQLLDDAIGAGPAGLQAGSITNGAGGSGMGGKAAAAAQKHIVPPCGTVKRDKARQIFCDALAVAVAEMSAEGVDPVEVAVAVESEVAAQCGDIHGAAYTAKIRTLSFNLKDPKNPDLRARVVLGEIPPARLVVMSAEELASDSMKRANEELRERAKWESTRGHTNQASTDMFQCGRCKKNKCTYYQLQTRSADEPMTTFVTCVNCNNRWKFC